MPCLSVSLASPCLSVIHFVLCVPVYYTLALDIAQTRQSSLLDCVLAKKCYLIEDEKGAKFPHEVPLNFSAARDSLQTE